VLIHPWDASLESAEWQEWLGHTDRFGVLAVNNADPGQAPVLVPTHFTVAGDELLVHLARPNPVWAHLEAATEVRLAVVGDYAYIPTYWRAKAGGPDEDGVPTSYYAAVQFVCRPTIVDDPEGKVDILTTQLGDFQPEGGYATVAVGAAPYGRMLRGIRFFSAAIMAAEGELCLLDDAEIYFAKRPIFGVLLVAVVAIARHVVESVVSRTTHASPAHV